MKKLVLMLVALAFVFGGCANYRDIRLVDVSPAKIKMLGVTKAEIGLTLLVDNPTKTTFTVGDLSGMIYKEGVEFARISLAEQFQVLPGTPSSAETKLRVEIVDPVSALVMGLDLKSWNIKNFTVDAQAQVKGRGIKKNLKIKDMPLDDLVEDLKFKE